MIYLSLINNQVVKVLKTSLIIYMATWHGCLKCKKEIKGKCSQCTIKELKMIIKEKDKLLKIKDKQLKIAQTESKYVESRLKDETKSISEETRHIQKTLHSNREIC